MEMNDLAVEVLLDDEARYKGFIDDFNEDSVLVSFESSDLTPRRVEYRQVFSPAQTGDDKCDNTSFAADDEAEVYCQVNKQGPFGWRPVIIKMVRGEFYMFNFKFNDQADVSEAENFRRKSDRTSIKPDSLFKFTATVVQPITIEQAVDPKNHRQLKSGLSPAKVSYDAEQNLLVVITTSLIVLNRARMLLDLHLRYLSTKGKVIQQIKDYEKQLEELSKPRANEPNAKYVEEFKVKSELIGLAIGAQRHNIFQAKELPGVLRIDFEDSGVFRVFAESKRAVEDARRMLEYDECTVKIPRKRISRIIGKGGSTMQEMVDRSGVISVRVEGDRERMDKEKDFVPISLTGTVESITNMSLIIEYLLFHLDEIDNLRTDNTSQAAASGAQQQQNSSAPTQVDSNTAPATIHPNAVDAKHS